MVFLTHWNVANNPPGKQMDMCLRFLLGSVVDGRVFTLDWETKASYAVSMESKHSSWCLAVELVKCPLAGLSTLLA